MYENSTMKPIKMLQKKVGGRGIREFDQSILYAYMDTSK
jgi:hypothetical protein